MDVAGSSAIVTGGASGLGAATARRLAAAGAHVVILDVQDGQELARELGGTSVQADVTIEPEVSVAVEAASEMGPLRVLVNCAGIGTPARTINRDGTPHDLQDFQRVIAINLIGTFNCIRMAAVAMAKTESVAAYDGQIGQAAYSASKGGIVGMTLPVARDLASAGIRVNTIAPGIIDTPMLAGLPDAARESLGEQVLNPKRLGTPDEYADLAYFLITHDYMNGESIRMDGGIRMAPK